MEPQLERLSLFGKNWTFLHFSPTFRHSRVHSNQCQTRQRRSDLRKQLEDFRIKLKPHSLRKSNRTIYIWESRTISYLCMDAYILVEKFWAEYPYFHEITWSQPNIISKYQKQERVYSEILNTPSFSSCFTIQLLKNSNHTGSSCDKCSWVIVLKLPNPKVQRYIFRSFSNYLFPIGWKEGE